MAINNFFKKCQTFIQTQINSSDSLIDESKKEEISIKNDCVAHDNNTVSSQINLYDNDIAKDLMYMVGISIEEWAKKYNMENMPKKIVFQQALSIMNSIGKIWFDE